jgi:hypothetical protein
MGCLHHYMAKPNLAAFYLQKALQENEAALKAFPKPDQGLNTFNNVSKVYFIWNDPEIRKILYSK